MPCRRSRNKPEFALPKQAFFNSIAVISLVTGVIIFRCHQIVKSFQFTFLFNVHNLICQIMTNEADFFYYQDLFRIENGEYL